jgi:uncharacterized protein (TIGR03643 family)
MAWADDISFDKIKKDKGLSEADVIKIMRKNLKARSFILWRKRVSGRSSKHEKRARLLRQEIPDHPVTYCALVWSASLVF